MRIRALSSALSATLVASLLALLLLAGGARAAGTPGVNLAALPFNPATQSHPGACSLDTLNVTEAVSDLTANGVLAQYAQAVGVSGSGGTLAANMRRALVVGRVAGQAVTDNHGCNGQGVVFNVGPRLLYNGETVGLALPRALRSEVCRGSTAGCKRVVLTAHTVFPTNCWNVNFGTVRVVVYVREPKAKPKPKPKPPVAKPVFKLLKVAKPSATAAISCSAGGLVVTLSNGASASVAASFKVDGKSYGPLAPGKQRTVTIPLHGGAGATLTVTSGGQTLIKGRSFTDSCTLPAAQASFSCAAGGVVVTISNGAGAGEVADFTVNGTQYGPLAPGASQQVTVPVTPGSSATVTVSSGGEVLINGSSYTSTCTAAPAAAAVAACTEEDDTPIGGGSITVQLSNAADATLGATFTVTATGNTLTGFGPTTFGPVAPGATLTEFIPIDGSGNSTTLTVSSGGVTLYSPELDPASDPFSGCVGEFEGE